MIIIKQGDMKKANNVKKFVCEKCGCEFEANEMEYETDQQKNEKYFHCTCPFCEEEVYSE